ncbi:MAG: 23S rRNA (guanosine(2251)-2'-O)-methyltransferase RlmB [Oscillospiraceae bacterium]|nr:23S rRNA (guanosine(2251)-2'-O)-methyltransferase RlmB [Oscillospiraceae bacterium]
MRNDGLIVYGKNPVKELLESSGSGGRINTLYLLKGSKSHGEFRALAKQQGIVVKEVAAEKLNSLSGGERHGGVAAELSALNENEGYASVEEILADSPCPFILMCDEIEDPHNLGALIRTAEAAGADGVIIPKRRGVAVTGAVYAASSGAAAHIKIARVTNLVHTIKDLKSRNIWVYGAESDGSPYTEVDFGGGKGVCLVIGSEGRGLGRLVRENCDFIVSIPMRGRVNSLNASVSGGILLFNIASKITANTANTKGCG